MSRMKKVFVVFCMILGLTGMTACAKREAVSVEAFNAAMEEKGYTIQDATDQIPADYIQAISLALHDDYQIELYVFTGADAAASVFAQNKSVFEERKGNSNVEVSKDIGNYSYYSLTTGGQYYLLSRVDNTMLYVVADEKYKKEITEIIKEFGY
ncbi:MAG: hypothetical protein ACI4TB_02065 [Lachnospiraceae bacterium]